jgi:RND family efflux transporter MFP subunit
MRRRIAMIALVPLIWWALYSPPTGPGPARASEKRAAMPPPLVTVAPVVEAEINPPAEYVGRIEALRAVNLRARVAGVLEERHFEEGATVQRGALLYRIEPAAYAAQVAVDRARVAQARATLDKAERYLRRLETVRSGGVSATDIETAQSDVAQSRAALQAAEATLTQSEINLGYTTITAPISGRIGKTVYSRGNIVGPESGALARIVQTDPIRVVFSASENDLPAMQRKRRSMSEAELAQAGLIRLRLPNGEAYPLAGRPDFMNIEVDPTTGTIALRAKFDNPDGFLVPGQYVTVLVSLSNPVKMPVVPQAAVLEDREGRYVFVVEGDGRAVQRRIETAETIGTVWAVKNGLVAGETIVVEGIQKVHPGQPVQQLTAGPGGKGSAR